LNIIIDIALVLIVAFCVYRGYRGGIIRGVCGFLAFLLAIVLANAAATAYSREFTDMLSPFVGGVVDSTLPDFLAPDIDFDILEDLPDGEGQEGVYAIAYRVLSRLGMIEPAARRMAEAVAKETNNVTYEVGVIITEKLSETLAYIAVFAVAFVLLLIVFAVVGNLLNFVFSLPILKLFDSIAGAAFGLLRGLVIIFFIALVLRYLGLLAPGTIEKTGVLEFLVRHNPIADALKL
jgi:uncharacterized membrane protein required for colicin V production